MEGRTLVLGGADIVDGSPVLDIKPYVAFCDSVAAATAPPWVAAKVRQGHGVNVGPPLEGAACLGHSVQVWQTRDSDTLERPVPACSLCRAAAG